MAVMPRVLISNGAQEQLILSELSSAIGSGYTQTIVVSALSHPCCVSPTNTIV